MATDSESATRDMPAAPPTSAPTRGRGRGGRGRGRGRGGGRGASQAAGVPKTTAPRGGRGGVRRGRAKNFSDSRVQAAYERQRDLKSVYQTVTAALKPALQELAERNVDEILADPDKFRNVDEHLPVISQLHERLHKSLYQSENRLVLDVEVAQKRLEGDEYVINQQFENAVADLFEQFYEGQANRLRILTSLHKKALPVDVRDDQYEYKTITDENFDNGFGIYEAYQDGHLVPYPSRVPGTDMWQKARDNDAASAAAALANAATNTAAPAPTRGRGRGRGGIKRKPAGDPDGVPTPKRSTRNTTDDLLGASMAPVPAKGLLASAAEADLPAETPFEDMSPDATPEPSSFMAVLRAKMGERDNPREKSPPLPKNLNDADEHGVRLYNAKPSMREKGANSRFLAPSAFKWENHEIGFRDSQNDSSKGHTVAKRGKYLDSPNSNGMHFDHWCIGYDYSKTTEGDFDQDLVKKHGVHPKYGIFLPEPSPPEEESTSVSNNTEEERVPYRMPGKPVVYIAEPSGRVTHASRSFQSTVNHRRNFDNPYRAKIGAALARFCKIEGIGADEISVDNYMPSHAELEERSLGTAIKELESRPAMVGSDDEVEPKFEDETALQAREIQTSRRPEEPCAGLFDLIAASEYAEAQAAAAASLPPMPEEQPKKQTKYDAIRDIFVTESHPEPQAKQQRGHASDEDTTILNILANACERVVEQPSRHDRHGIGHPFPQRAPEAQVPISQEREMLDRPIMSDMRGMYDRPPLSDVRETYERPPISDVRGTYNRPPTSYQRGTYGPNSNNYEMDDLPPISSERENYERSTVAYPVPPRSSEAPYPMSNERGAPNAPSSLSRTYRDPRMSIESHNNEAPRRAVEAASAQSAYHPVRQSEPLVEASPYARGPEHPVEISPYARQPDEASPYARQLDYPAESYPYARQMEPSGETSTYTRQPIPEPPSYTPRSYEQPPSHQVQPPVQHQAPPPQAAPPGPPHEYRTPYGYGPPPHEQAAYPPPGYPQSEQRDQRDYRDPREPPMPPQGRPYEHSLEDRRTSGYSESPTFSRPHWQQPGAQAPPPQAGSTQTPQPPLQPGTPSQTSGYPLPPPPSRGPFSSQSNADVLPSLRPSRGRLLGAAPEDPNIDPAMRQGSQSSFNTFYSSTPSRGLQNSYPPPEHMRSTPQQGYMGSPPYGPPSVSPTFGTIMMHSPEQGQGMFRHRPTNSGSGPPGSAAAQNNKYRQLQPAPIPPHRNWSSKPELKTIPYDHKAPDGNTAQLPNSGPTTIRGWQVNPQSRRAQQAQREKHLESAAQRQQEQQQQQQQQQQE